MREKQAETTTVVVMYSADTRKVKITARTDDTVASEALLAEHGVSILVELASGYRWLIDTGTTDISMENARRMGISLDNLTGIAITRGHDDHTGGLTFYSRLKGKPPVYGHPYIWHKSCQIRPGQPVRITGTPYLARKVTAPFFHAVNHVAQLDDGLCFFTDIPGEPGSFAPIAGNFFNEDGTAPVPLIDDVAILIRIPEGLIVIIGCDHAGYTNILGAIHKEFPGEKPLAVIGGPHLTNASETVPAETILCTRRFMADRFAFHCGHCTGKNALRHFRKAFGEKAVRPIVFF
ncbi:MBL fold metallo-hydrolase [Oxalobacter aliiformigenes]|uniref:MBL fold metallo-hydrolase n=1 Tax=Oxalobacter aliiformigenes TaxID=2946593 RepID=UPI0022AF7AB2|nr:MBL fold metallo-hydrolase [Oxalobacter aliiformigenes]MCZ4064741.1 MBL fold metallo-hydrolase [Oxalobacter aliiformigenes]WAV99971.1 MBL fold metallo-hydrolase [Oxalobacter aliiformigenes]